MHVVPAPREAARQPLGEPGGAVDVGWVGLDRDEDAQRGGHVRRSSRVRCGLRCWGHRRGGACASRAGAGRGSGWWRASTPTPAVAASAATIGRPSGGRGRVALAEQGYAEQHGDDRVDDGEARDDHFGRPGREGLLDEPAARQDGGDHARERGEDRGVEDADLSGGDGLRSRPHQRGHQAERGGTRHGAGHAAGPAGAGEPDAREHQHDEPHDDAREQHRPTGCRGAHRRARRRADERDDGGDAHDDADEHAGRRPAVRAGRREHDGDRHGEHADGLHHRQRRKHEGDRVQRGTARGEAEARAASPGLRETSRSPRSDSVPEPRSGSAATARCCSTAAPAKQNAAITARAIDGSDWTSWVSVTPLPRRMPAGATSLPGPPLRSGKARVTRR